MKCSCEHIDVVVTKAEPGSVRIEPSGGAEVVAYGVKVGFSEGPLLKDVVQRMQCTQLPHLDIGTILNFQAPKNTVMNFLHDPSDLLFMVGAHRANNENASETVLC